VIEGLVTVYGSASVENFSHYRVEFGVSHAPEAWGILQGDTPVPVLDGILGQGNLSAYENGPMSIRLIVFDREGRSAERVVHFTLMKPEPTPAPPPAEEGEPPPTREP
nr:hypothetical protein [Anaerolineae bacterium]